MIRPDRRKTQRGFTLAELMVALSAGLIVAGAAYQLSQVSMEVFISESRVSTAQDAASIGITRVQGDFQRAGFMSNPNIAADTGHQCGPQPAYVTPENLGAVRIQVNTGTTESTVATPETVDLVGNFTTTELLDFRTINAAGRAFLQIDRPATQRLIDAWCAGGASFDEIFPVGHFVRIVDNKGFEQYRIINAVTVMPGGTPRANCALGIQDVADIFIDLDSAPASTAMCGPSVGRGLINPVSRIRYLVGTPDAGNGLNPGDVRLYNGGAGRSEDEVVGPALIRQQLDATGAVVAADVVAPHTVDFEVAGTYRNGPGPAAVHLRPDYNDAAFDTVPPQRFIGLRALLATRTRGPDRDTAGGLGPVSSAGTGARVDIGANAKGRRFARLRNMFIEVSLPNMAQATF